LSAFGSFVTLGKSCVQKADCESRKTHMHAMSELRVVIYILQSNNATLVIFLNNINQTTILITHFLISSP
jgi:hypothetical protein